MSTVPVLPAQIHGRQQDKAGRLVIVEDPHDGPVRVRWRLGKEQPWTCDLCGQQATADCEHTFSAGLVLAEALLGLTRTPDLQENQ